VEGGTEHSESAGRTLGFCASRSTSFAASRAIRAIRAIWVVVIWNDNGGSAGESDVSLSEGHDPLALLAERSGKG
jgi:hypothetical protein